MKWVLVGFDPDQGRFTCYGAETIPLSHWRYLFTDYFIL